MYDSFIPQNKIAICFHKSCVDGLFSAIIIISCLQDIYSYFSDFYLVPLSPTEIIRRSKKIQTLENQKKIILDLPRFGSNTLYYFDHHITNQQTSPINEKSGLLDFSAASTCSVMKKFFSITEESDLSKLVKIADVVDSAKFTDSPPGFGLITLNTDDDIIWACNDLIKDTRDDKELIELIESFDIGNLQKWILQHKSHIQNYRKRRQQTLDIKDNLVKAPIIIIKNEVMNLQAEGLHFSLAAEDKDYIMLILIDKINRSDKSKNKRYKVSFRLNPNLTETETEKYRVDKIASQLGGGGHKGAASTTINNGNQYKKIIEWVSNLSVKYAENQI